jgi:hypothetical protein
MLLLEVCIEQFGFDCEMYYPQLAIRIERYILRYTRRSIVDFSSPDAYYKEVRYRSFL